MSENDPGDFTLVLKSKKERKLKNTYKIRSSDLKEDLMKTLDNSTTNIENIKLRFDELSETLKANDFFLQVLDSVTNLAVETIVSYGLGNFSFLDNSLIQLALLMELKSLLGVECYVSDPVFTKNEERFMTDLGLRVQNENDECCFSAEVPTLFFMIHCGAAMYNNVLWSNFCPNKLRNCFILGNSFASFADVAALNINVRNDATFVLKLAEVVDETFFTLKSDSDLFLPFSGTSLHNFSSEKLSSLSAEFWTLYDRSKPKYENFSSIILRDAGS